MANPRFLPARGARVRNLFPPDGPRNPQLSPDNFSIPDICGSRMGFPNQVGLSGTVNPAAELCQNSYPPRVRFSAAYHTTRSAGRENTASIQPRIGRGSTPSATLASAQIQMTMPAGAVTPIRSSVRPPRMYICRMIRK